MNNKTILLEEYVNFDDLKKKQKRYFKIIIVLFVFILCLFLLFVFFLKMIQSNIYTNIRRILIFLVYEEV